MEAMGVAMGEVGTAVKEATAVKEEAAAAPEVTEAAAVKTAVFPKPPTSRNPLPNDYKEAIFL